MRICARWGTARIGTVVALLSICAGCSKAPYVWASEIPKERAAPAEARKAIGAGDTISVVVTGQPQLTTQHLVGTDGRIVIPTVGAVLVAGMEANAAAEAIRQRLLEVFTEPQVAVSVVSRSIEVTVLGEVQAPGKVQLKSGEGVASAIAMSGGLTEFARRNAIYLVRSTEKYRIRFRMNDLLRGGNSARAFALRDGDLVVVE